MMLLAALILLLGNGVFCQIDTSNCTFNQDFAQCKKDNPVKDNWAANTQIKEFVYFTDFSVAKICGENFSKLTQCVIGAYRACGDNKTTTKLVALPKHYNDAVNEICTQKAVYGESCVKDATYKTCLTDEASNVTKPTSDAEYKDYKKYTCDIHSIRVKCAEDTPAIKDCEKDETLTIYKQVLKNLKPPACGGSSTVYAAVLLVATFMASFVL